MSAHGGGVSAGGDVGGAGMGEEVVCHVVKYDKPTKLYIHTDWYSTFSLIHTCILNGLVTNCTNG